MLEGSKENLERVFRQADWIDTTAGMGSFIAYNSMMRQMSKKFGFTLQQCAAVFAALSPNNDYLKTLRSAVTLMDGYRRRVDPEVLTVSTYNACKYRAWRFLNGENFLDVTKGKKTRAFYICIVDPLDKDAVVVDGHMVSAWLYRRMTKLDVALNRFNYDQVAADVRSLADDLGLLPCQLQGVIWFTWKRINQVLYKPTLDLFGDHWQLDRSIDDIRPYPDKQRPISDVRY